MSFASPKAKEKNLWKWLSKASLVFKRALHLRRMENEVGSGTPDTNGCLTMADFWIELKTTNRPARATTKITHSIQPGQAPWHRGRRAAGGRSFVLIQVGSASAALRYLIPGEWIAQTASGMLEKDMAEICVVDPASTAEQIIQAAATAILPPYSGPQDV